MEINNQIRKDVLGILFRVIFFIIYYVTLIVLGIGLFVLAGYATYLTKDFVFAILDTLGRFGVIIFLPYIAIWFFCFRMGWYLIRPLFVFPKNTDPSRVEIKSNECEDLYALIKDVAEKTGNKMPKHIYLSADVNAYVFYNSSSIWSLLFPTNKSLTIGIGLLYGMNDKEIKAILAHEFGHFSQKTMRIGIITYRLLLITRTMVQYSEENLRNEALERQSKDYSWFMHLESKPIEGLTKQTIKIYKSIERKNRNLSRYMELEADNMACSIVGPKYHVSALCKLEIMGKRYDEFESLLGNLLKNGFYLSDYKKGLLYFNNCISNNALYKIEFDNTIAAPIGDDNIYTSKVTIIDGWNTHPTLSERIKNAKNWAYDTFENEPSSISDAFELIDESIINKVGLVRQQVINALMNNRPAIHEIGVADFIVGVDKYVANDRVPDFIYPFVERRFHSFELPSIESNAVESIYPYSNENRNLFLELKRAEEDMELIESIIKSSEKVHFTYNNKVNSISEMHSGHTKYLNDCWNKILSVDRDIYIDLCSKTPDKKHIDSIYQFMFYCNDCLLRLKELHNKNQLFISQVRYYGHNSDKIDVDINEITTQIKSFLQEFDFENVLDSYGNMRYDEDLTIYQKLKEWSEFANEPATQSGAYKIVNEVWDFISSIYSINYEEWKQRVISSYKGIPYES